MSAVTLNLLSAVNLSENGTVDNPIFHFVYGSDLYGSLFGVYAKFSVEKSGDECRLKSCELSLHNYRGAVTIGFSYHLPYYAHDSTLDHHQIFFGVQGNRSENKKEFIIPGDIIVSKTSPQTFWFNRILYPMPDFHFDLDKIPNPTERRVVTHDFSIFDSEFCYRNGIDYYYQTLRPGMYGFEQLKMLTLKDRIPSARCHTGVAKLFVG